METIRWVESSKSTVKKSVNVQQKEHEPTAEEIEKIKHRYISGEYPLVIAYEMNVKAKSVFAIIENNYNVDVCKPQKLMCSKMSTQQSQMIIALYNEGNTVKEIATMVDISYGKVYRFISNAIKSGRIEVSHKQKLKESLEKRNEQILFDLNNGFTYAQAAKKYCLSVDSIGSIVSSSHIKL